MRYQIRLSETAEADLVRIAEPAVRHYALRQLDFLGENPTSLSRPSHFPYREKCQLFSFNYDYASQRWEFNVLLQYASDEIHIHSLAIGWSVRDFWEGFYDPDEPNPGGE